MIIRGPANVTKNVTTDFATDENRNINIIGDKFFIMSTEFDKNILDLSFDSADCTNHINGFETC